MSEKDYILSELTAVIKRQSVKGGWDRKRTPTVLLKYVRDENGKLVTPRIWMNFPKNRTMADFKPGDQIIFEAYIVQDEDGRVQQLVRARNLRKIEREKKIIGVHKSGETLRDFVAER